MWLDEELDLVTFTDEDGNELTMEVLDYFFYEGDEYALLAEVEDEDECECGEHECSCEECESRQAYVMKVVPVGDDEEEFIPVDEELSEKLIEIVEHQLYSDEDEDDDEDEEDEEDEDTDGEEK